MKMSLTNLTFSTLHDGFIHVSGDTFPYEESFRAVGGWWSFSLRAWLLPPQTNVNNIQISKQSERVVNPCLPTAFKIP